MDSTTALREWCIEKAMELHLRNGTAQKVEYVIKTAKEIEEYINSTDTYSGKG